MLPPAPAPLFVWLWSLLHPTANRDVYKWRPTTGVLCLKSRRLGWLIGCKTEETLPRLLLAKMKSLGETPGRPPHMIHTPLFSNSLRGVQGCKERDLVLCRYSIPADSVLPSQWMSNAYQAGLRKAQKQVIHISWIIRIPMIPKLWQQV